MDRNEGNGNRVQLPCAERTQPVEVTAEITLPDYRSEISRLLWVRPTVLPPTRFMGGGRAELSGAIRYDILYVGSDGRLYDAATEEGYAFSVPTDASGGAQELLAEVEPEAVISRVAGPRKLSVRCRMRAAVRSFAEKELAPAVRGGKDSAPERLCEVASALRYLQAHPVHCKVGGTIGLDPSAGEVRALSPHGELFLQDVSATDTGILCRGEVLLTLLICKEETGAGEPVAISHRFPFEQEIPTEGISPDCRARAMGKVGEIRMTVEQDRIDVEMEASVWGEAQAEEDVILCRDMYLPGHAADRQFCEEQLQVKGVCGNRNFSVSGEKPLEELSLSSDILPVCTVADAEITDRRTEGDKTLLSGEVHCHTLCRFGAEYGVAEFSVPFRTALEGVCNAVDVQASVPRCSVSVLRGALHADAEVALAISASGCSTERVLAQVGFSAAPPLQRADMELFYPANGDTLWDVARRYGVPSGDLAAANGLASDSPGDADSLLGVKYLLIP